MSRFSPSLWLVSCVPCDGGSSLVKMKGFADPEQETVQNIKQLAVIVFKSLTH